MAKFRGAILSCGTCGKEFKVSPNRAATAKYCSNKCAGVGRGLDFELPKVAIVCKWCGKTFFEHRCHADRRTYCSNDCRLADPVYREGCSERGKGEGNAMWTGGIAAHTDGYIYEYCPEHPLAKGRYVLQHRLVMERHLREHYPESPCLIKFGEQLYLNPELSVHHDNEDKTDNRVENLRVMTMSDHNKLHNALRRAKKLEGE